MQKNGNLIIIINYYARKVKQQQDINESEEIVKETIETYRTSSVCNTSGSCKYDNAVKSFCPINIPGFRKNGN